jgi:hypothetical protein
MRDPPALFSLPNWSARLRSAPQIKEGLTRLGLKYQKTRLNPSFCNGSPIKKAFLIGMMMEIIVAVAISVRWWVSDSFAGSGFEFSIWRGSGPREIFYIVSVCVQRVISLLCTGSWVSHRNDVCGLGVARFTGGCNKFPPARLRAIFQETVCLTMGDGAPS